MLLDRIGGKSVGIYFKLVPVPVREKDIHNFHNDRIGGKCVVYTYRCVASVPATERGYE